MDEEKLARMRQWMLTEIAVETACVRDQIGKAQLDPQVMSVMGEVPRHVFVPAAFQAEAYLNQPVPIGYGKTISQPFIVALMTDLLDLHPTERVLEIGTGLGYQTAVLSRLAREVYSVERLAGLAREARQRLDSLGYANIQTRVGDGYLGWPEHAPFDRIMVTAAPPQLPPALLTQLRNGGRMVLPVGPHDHQALMLVRKDAQGQASSRVVLPVRFSALEEGEAGEPW